MTGAVGGGGGSSGNSGAGNIFSGAGGGFAGASTDPNAYSYTGGQPDYTWGNTSPATNVGTPQDPTQVATQAAQATSPAPAATTAPGGQQSQPTQPSWMDSVSQLLFGSGAPTAQGSPEAIKYQQQATEPGPGGNPGWTQSQPFDPNAAPNDQAAPGGSPAGAAVASRPPASAPMGTPTPQTQTPTPPTPFPTETASAGPPSGWGDATVSPQSSQNSGGNTATSPTAAPAAVPATPPAASNYPDVAGSARESGGGPGISDASAGGGAPTSAATGGGQQFNPLGGALGDLLQLNFGKFIADLLGQGGMPPSQNYAGAQPPGGPAPAPGATADTGTPSATDGRPETVEQSGPAGPASPNRAGVYATPSGMPQETQAPGTMGTIGTAPGQPTISPQQMGFLPRGQQPQQAAAPGQNTIAGQPVALTPSLSGGGATGSWGDPGGASAAPTPEPINTPPGGQPMPDGSRQPTNGMPGGTTPKAPPAAAGYGAIPNQANRPRQYGGEITMPDGSKFKYSTGGGQFASLPYGTYHINPGAIGSTGRRIGAWAGIGDSGTGNTVNDPLYRGAGGGHARDGVEIHPDVDPSGRHRTNGCIGIDRSQASAFGRAFKSAAAQGPMTLTVRPDGSASISYASGSLASAAQPKQPRWANALPGAGGAQANPSQGAAAPGNIRYGTRGDRNRNPGNIKMGVDARQFGATGVDNEGHAIFPTVQAGIQAQASLLRRSYNNKTVPEMGHSYARDKGWAKGVMEAGGFRPNERLNLNDPATMNRLQKAIWKQEGTHPRDVEASSTTYGAQQLEHYAKEAIKQGIHGLINYGPMGRASPLRTYLQGLPGEPGGIAKEGRASNLRSQAGLLDIDRLLGNEQWPQNPP